MIPVPQAPLYGMRLCYTDTLCTTFVISSLEDGSATYLSGNLKTVTIIWKNTRKTVDSGQPPAHHPAAQKCALDDDDDPVRALGCPNNDITPGTTATPPHSGFLELEGSGLLRQRGHNPLAQYSPSAGPQ